MHTSRTNLGPHKILTVRMQSRFNCYGSGLISGEERHCLLLFIEIVVAEIVGDE